MKKAHRLLTIATCALFALALPVSAQDVTPGIKNPTESTPTTMYVHVNGIQDAPMNTQHPDDRYQQSDGLGLVTHSQGCVGDPLPGLVANTHHTYYAYSSPGYVEYDFDEGGKPRYHPERGISFDVKLDTSKDAVITWYMESQLTGGDGEPVNPNSIVPSIIPSVVARATIRSGDDISVGHTALNEGPVIAQGQTEPLNLAGEATPTDNPTAKKVGKSSTGGWIYEFTVTAPVELSTINKDESYNLRIDLFMSDVPGCDGSTPDQYIMADQVRVHTSPEFRPTIDWSVFNPLRIEYLHPQFIGDDLVVHTSTNSPWGNYDVRGDKADEAQGGLEVTIAGPSIPVTFNQVAMTARTHEHDHHTEAVDATWVWEYKKDGAKDGLYTITMRAKNDQETAEAFAIAQFEIGSGLIRGCGGQEKGGGADDCFDDIQKDGGAKVEESPGVGALAILGLLGAAGIVLRRRN